MTKKKNKSRLTKTDVNTICEMQRKIDAYELYFVALLFQADRPDIETTIPLRGTDKDNEVQIIWRNIDSLRNRVKVNSENGRTLWTHLTRQIEAYSKAEGSPGYVEMARRGGRLDAYKEIKELLESLYPDTNPFNMAQVQTQIKEKE